MAAAGGIIKKLFGPNSVTRQFFVWTVAQGVVNAVLAPMFQAILNRANTVNPNVPASPALLADMVDKGVAGIEWARDEARKSGTHPNIFNLMVETVGIPPPLADMLHLWRRGKVTRDAVERAIRQSHVKKEWVDTILLLGVQPPTHTDILEAYLEGQVGEARARELFAQLGGDPEFFDLLYNTRGSAPTPNEAADMARKRIIPWEGTGPGVVSFEQAFKEGPWRNKWLEPWRRTTEYLPPPRTITAMLREGSVTVAEATDLLQRQGVPNELIASYLTDASTGKTQKAKELTESVISTLYQENAIDDNQARAFLGKLRYEPSEANFVLTAWQLARELRYRNTAISTVRTQFISHRIGVNEASMALDKFGVPSTQRQHLLALWTEEEKLKVTLLTAAQVKSAFKKDLLSIEEAMQRLIDQGYSEQDALIYLAI
jgi:hypothetical protein